VIILTSNAGAREIARERRLGFGGEKSDDFKEIKAAALDEVRAIFSPEFLNRLDEVIIFRTLDAEQIEAIFDIQLAALDARLAEKGCGLNVKESARKLLLEKCIDRKYGARMVRRVIADYLEEALSLRLLRGSRPAEFVASAAGGKVVLKAKTEKAPADPLPPPSLPEILSPVPDEGTVL
jgi:ATP-dependent Clp protease ATP-binding subunit ClpC